MNNGDKAVIKINLVDYAGLIAAGITVLALIIVFSNHESDYEKEKRERKEWKDRHGYTVKYMNKDLDGLYTWCQPHDLSNCVTYYNARVK